MIDLTDEQRQDLEGQEQPRPARTLDKLGRLAPCVVVPCTVLRVLSCNTRRTHHGAAAACVPR
jgi:hypothetical protein